MLQSTTGYGPQVLIDFVFTVLGVHASVEASYPRPASDVRLTPSDHLI